MAKSSIAELKQRVLDAEEERDYYKSLCDSFDTGDVPQNSSLKHRVYAQWGRKRLEGMRGQPALLVKQAT